MQAPLRSISTPVFSNQAGPHEDLEALVEKHARSPFKRPIARHTADAFNRLLEVTRLSSQPIILDSGCGTADSSLKLAEDFPGHMVLGIDKSEYRLSKERKSLPGNLILLRADLIDLWRLLKSHGIAIERHYIFYPNPWPKSKHLTRRWHGHPVFLAMLKLGARLELRSNWEIYAAEFSRAIEYLIRTGFIDGVVRLQSFEPDKPLTAFEKKYHDSGHKLYRVVFNSQSYAS